MEARKEKVALENSENLLDTGFATVNEHIAANHEQNKFCLEFIVLYVTRTSNSYGNSRTFTKRNR